MTTLAIHLWQPKPDQHNFGELLGMEILKRRGFGVKLIAAMTAEEREACTDVVIPIGTAFSRQTEKFLPAGAKRHYWGCGFGCDAAYRLADFPNSVIHGVRGPMSFGALGVPQKVPFGDPGLLAPRFWTFENAGSGGVLYAAHIHNVGKVTESFVDLMGADAVFDPRCAEGEFQEKLRQIVEAEFVVTSSLHVAIVRVAYGLPWAFAWPPGCLPEYPFKYFDFCQAVGIPFERCLDLRAARKWWAATGSAAVVDAQELDALIAIFPFEP